MAHTVGILVGVALIASVVLHFLIPVPAEKVPLQPLRVRLFRIVLGLVSVAMLLQVILGAYLRHVEWRAGVLVLHALGGLAIAMLIIGMVVLAFEMPKALVGLRRTVFGVAIWVQVQILLGIFAFALSGLAWVGTLHHVGAGVLLAAVAMIAVRARQSVVL